MKQERKEKWDGDSMKKVVLALVVLQMISLTVINSYIIKDKPIVKIDTQEKPPMQAEIEKEEPKDKEESKDKIAQQTRVIDGYEHLEIKTYADRGYITIKVDERLEEKKEINEEIVLRFKASTYKESEELSRSTQLIVSKQMLGKELKIPVLEYIGEDKKEDLDGLNIILELYSTETGLSRNYSDLTIFSPDNEEFESLRYLSSTEFIDFEDYGKSYYSKKITRKIKEDSITEEQFIMQVFNMVAKIEYDYEFLEAAEFNEFYIPVADRTLNKGKGICSDKAILLAVMLRSQGVPTKYVSGYVGNEAHAWNEVLLNGVWVPVDATSGQFNIDSRYLPDISY